MKRQPIQSVEASVGTSPIGSVNLDVVAIGARIKTARKAIRLTQDALAARAGATSNRGLQDNEAGKTMPGGQMIGALVSSGINANWLLTGEGPMLLADLAVPTAAQAAPAIVYPQDAAPTALAFINETPSAVPAPQPAPMGPVFDPKLLQQVVDFFYAWQLQNKDRVRIGAKAHGAVIAVLYKVASASGKVVPDELEQVLSIAA